MTRLVGTNFKTKGSFVMGLFAQSCNIHWAHVKSAGKLILCNKGSVLVTSFVK